MSKDTIRNRIGIFHVTERFFYSDDFIPNLFTMMSFRPTRVEYNYGSGMFIYEGLSPEFDLLKQGEEIPLYAITFSNGSDLKELGVNKTDQISRRQTRYLNLSERIR